LCQLRKQNHESVASLPPYYGGCQPKVQVQA